MKKSTKSSLIIFIVTLIVGYVMTCFIPDELLNYTILNGSILSFIGDEVTKLVGMRTIIAVALALITVLLIRIVDTREIEENNKVEKKAATKKVKKAEKKETK